MAKARTNRWKVILNVVTIVALGGLVFVLRKQIWSTLQSLDDVNAWWLLLMIPAQMLNYHSYTQMYRDLFATLGATIPYKQMLRIVSELNFVNNVFPSGGVSGFSYFGLRMRHFGVTAGKATLVQMMRFILLFVGFQALLLTGLILLAIEGKASSFLILIAGSLATMLIIGTVAAAFIVGSQRRINIFFTYITKFVNRLIHILRPKHPETINIARVQNVFNDLHENYMVLKANPGFLRKPLKYALFAVAGELVTIYVVYIAFGQWINPGAIIIAYAIANFAGLVSVLPGGVGIYEALMTAVLASAGVPAAIAIPVTIMYRVLSMLLQLPPGYFFYNRAIRGNETAPVS